MTLEREVERRWQHAADVITRETGRRVRRLTAELAREDLDSQPSMWLNAVEFADGRVADGQRASLLMEVREIENAIHALAPTLRLRRGVLSASATWPFRDRLPRSRRTPFRDLIG